ncbi:MAG: calcium/sodium antiporter [Woeseiaceae bacterium]|nr:calcium/sodium antiporter [Woeseiaceae bacterium]
MISFFGIVLGVVILIAGGTALVRGASEIAARFGISPMVIGLTVVAFGTSAPELVVNIFGALSGATGLAFGNVVGSNIGNLGLVLGAAAIMSPIAIRGQIVRREVPLLLLATTMMMVMSLDRPLENLPPAIRRTEAIVLLLMFCIVIYITALDFLRVQKQDPLLNGIVKGPASFASGSGRYRWLLALGGFALLFVGGELTIRYGVAFATQMGVSPAIIGLFVVAIGTSMPELATSIIAAMRGQPDLALGNVIGSNIFNSLIVLPVSGAIAEISVPSGGVGDLLISWLLVASLIPLFVFGRAYLGRRAGAFLLIVYFGYAIYRIQGV